ARDSLLQRLGLSKTDVGDLVINNSRFLILPHVHVPNLASTLLSLATRRVVIDWKDYYSIEPVMVETFVLA
ncbi:MAG: Druantia anti-phage system protein DruA, partial [Dehalococcoidia bacterium]